MQKESCRKHIKYHTFHLGLKTENFHPRVKWIFSVFSPRWKVRVSKKKNHPWVNFASPTCNMPLSFDTWRFVQSKNAYLKLLLPVLPKSFATAHVTYLTVYSSNSCFRSSSIAPSRFAFIKIVSEGKKELQIFIYFYAGSILTVAQTRSPRFYYTQIIYFYHGRLNIKLRIFVWTEFFFQLLC